MALAAKYSLAIKKKTFQMNNPSLTYSDANTELDN